MNKLLIVFLLFCAPLYAQVVISGFVYDEAENKPLEGGYVYIDGTTFSVSTNSKGYFRIGLPQKYNAALVVSYVGFETLRIEDPYQFDKPFKVVLREDVTELAEVVVTNKNPFSRRQMLAVFRKEFLGKTKAGRSCKIENEDDIYLYYDLSTNALRARASKPIRIQNKRLGYNVVFDLRGFSVQYNTMTLDEHYMRQSFFAGTTFYTDVSKNGGADKNRVQAYRSSTAQLMKGIYNNDIAKDKFTLYLDKTPITLQEAFVVTDSAGYKKVALNKTLLDAMDPANENLVLAKAGDRHWKYSRFDIRVLHNMDVNTNTIINFYRPEFYIDRNGSFFPVDAFVFRGYMGMLKAGDLLPANYTETP